MHVIDHALQILALSRSHVAGGGTGVLELARLQGHIFQLRPLQQLSVIDPLRDHADRAHDAAVIGVDLVGRGRHVIGPACSHGFDRGHDALLLIVANALDLAINFLRRRHSPTWRIHVQDDRFDRVVVPEFLELLHDRVGRENYALQIDHANLVAKGKRGVFARVQGHVHQRKHRQHEQEKGSPANHDPEKGARTLFFSHS